MRQTRVSTPVVIAAVAVVAIVACGCATGTSAAAASAHGRASVYRSATAYVRLAPDQAFNPAVNVLLERGDVEITDLKEAHNRCKAVEGDHKLTFRVIESGDGRSRLSMLVGGGDNPDANQELADDVIRKICAHLPVPCEFGAVEP